MMDNSDGSSIMFDRKEESNSGEEDDNDKTKGYFL